jgi:hypothetical protein
MHRKDDDEEFLGDGLYASFDGWQFRLRSGDHVVYLGPATLGAFARYCKRCQEKANELPVPSRASHMS